ncbi:hypothetical protein KSP39_PZI006539 [Platanthera zijinensis]|uniref:Uncharacterized protein n=1 Tax=Platanthera zijinensis TaxID=2320716 RepID=A0AAP0G982_9ASPA
MPCLRGGNRQSSNIRNAEEDGAQITIDESKMEIQRIGEDSAGRASCSGMKRIGNFLCGSSILWGFREGIKEHASGGFANKEYM